MDYVKEGEVDNLSDVDLVYLWVDGTDDAWRKRKATFTQEHYSDVGMNSEARYADHQELRYSLRSAEKYAPWIRKIFIVTDRQIPEWLDTSNPKIRIVDHSEILDPETMPCFNSNVIEHHLHRIPGLSEHFLYANDDMLFNRPVEKKDFFMADGYPIVRFNRRLCRKLWLKFLEKGLKKPTNSYNLAIQRSALLVEKKYGRYIGHKTHHNIDAYRKSDFLHTFLTFEKEIKASFKNHIRGDSDVQRNIYSFVPVVEKKAHVKFVSQKTSFRCHIEKPYYFDRLKKYNPLLFCLNDSEYADAGSYELMREFLEWKFPEKSSFEK